MTAITNTPTNRNFLSPTGLRFLVKKMPHVNFFIQKANIPGISITPVEQGNPFVNIPHSGDHIFYNELVVTFKVDEDLKNYLEVHNWMKGLGFPTNHQEYADLKAAGVPGSGEGLKSDASLIILTSAKNINYEVAFRDCFPTQLTDIIFDTTDRSVTYLSASAAFRYVSYSIDRMSGT